MQGSKPSLKGGLKLSQESRQGSSKRFDIEDFMLWDSQWHESCDYSSLSTRFCIFPNKSYNFYIWSSLLAFIDRVNSFC